jgi:hypothetical protein
VRTQPGQRQMSIPTAKPFVPIFSADGKREDPSPHPTSKTWAPSGMAACSTKLPPK